ncbi:Long_chain fatty acid CoA ligase [Hexamita inflata]|uniref:Long chain fatty acid CoA ligase n=1 Tax=Hexamita inflata TaxID=28002 RepID=A0AA86PC66_9EUKA|nr:Long chain fatty acid CoA ligase [Hexamita inflata]
MQTYDCNFNAPSLDMPENVSTFPKLLRTKAQSYPNRRFLGTREYLNTGFRGAYEWYSYQDVDRICALLAQGLTEIGLKRGDKAGIISSNRTEWTIVDFACSIAGIVLVPIYDTQSAEDIAYVCQDAELKICFSSLDRLEKIKAVKDKFETVVVFDDRVDDRAYLQQKLDAKLLPANVYFQPRAQNVFDEFDKEEGIYDPAPENKAYPKVDKDGYSDQICRLRRNQNGFFSYKIEDKWLSILTKSAKAADVSFVSHTFWKLVQLGYEKFFSKETNEMAHSNTEVPVDVHVTTPDSLLSLVYTSGTTGQPKGVMLTQANVCTTGYSMNKHCVIPQSNPINSLGQKMTSRQEYQYSLLPLAHIYMRALQVLQLNNAGCLGNSQGVAYLLSDLKELRITIFVAVPRVIQKIVDGIKGKIEASSSLKKKLFQKLYNLRRKTFLKIQQQYNEQIWQDYREDKQHHKILSEMPKRRFEFPAVTNIVFNQFEQMLGGRARWIVNGSAPLSYQNGEFFAICFNMHVFEGYGMTETSATGCIQDVDSVNYGAIGKSLDKETQIRIMSVPEMNYDVKDTKIVSIAGHQESIVCPRGELLMKGPTVFSGYYNDPVKTEESFIDGYFATGDIAEFNPVTQEVKLIDRKRGIVKLSQGEFISINHIENTISKSRYVESVFLYANRYHSYTLAVVLPNEQYFQQNGFAKGENLSRSAAAIKMLTEDVKRICKECQLKSFEIPKVILIENEPWTPDNGLLTPALKIKRPSCSAKYDPVMLSISNKIDALTKETPDSLVESVISALDDLIVTEPNSCQVSDTLSTAKSSKSTKSKRSVK